MDEQKLRYIKENGHYLSVPSGVSMRPMLKSKENIVDVVPFEGKLKKYDVALYYRKSDNRCVLHRILWVKEDHYIFVGDNCWQKEIVPFSEVMGVGTRFYRNGKWIDFDNKWYRLYAHIWVSIYPIRYVVFRVRDKIRRRSKR